MSAASFMNMEIPQESWVGLLSQPGSAQSEAIAKLREILVKRLSMTFHDQTAVDSSFVEDAVQDALLKILNSLGQFEGRSKFTTWATTIAIRVVYTELRRKRWKDFSLDEMLETQGDFFSAPNANHDSETNRQRLIDVMNMAIRNGLTSKQRVAIQAELAGIPMEEIGRQTGSNRNAIYKLTHDARKRLRTALEAAGFTKADFLSLQGSDQ